MAILQGLGFVGQSHIGLITLDIAPVTCFTLPRMQSVLLLSVRLGGALPALRLLRARS
jgi:hypothetical protein